MSTNKALNCLIESRIKLPFYVCILGTCVSYIFQLLNFITISRWGIIAVLIIYLYGCFISFLHRKKISPSTAWQMFWISFLFTLFWDLALFSPLTSKGNDMTILFGTMSLNVSTILWALILCNEIDFFDNILSFIRKNRYIFILITLFFALCFNTISNWPRIDSLDYYTEIKKATAWDFTFNTFGLLQFCNHNTFGFSLFALIGEFIWPGDGQGVRLIQICLVCITLGAFSGIIRYLELDHGHDLENAVITSIFAFTPLILGLIFEIGSDLPMACFFIWLLYSHYNKKHVFELASIFLLLFTKEPSIILLFGFSFGYVLYSVIEAIRNKEVFSLLNNRVFSHQLVVIIFPVVFFLCSFILADKWTASAGNSSISILSNTDQLYGFGFNPTNIFVKTKEFTAMNFAWLILFAAIIAVFFVFFRRKSVVKSRYLSFWISIISSVLFFYLFNIFYITYCNPRYLTAYFAVLPIIFAGAVCLVSNCRCRLLTYFVVAVLFVVQSFVTIDPLMLKAFKNIDVGDCTIITTRTFVLRGDGVSTLDEDVSHNEMTHAASYNREYSYISDLFEKALHEVNYDDSTLIILAPIYGEGMTRITFLGDRVSSSQYYYNQNTNHLTFDAQQTLLHYYIPKSTDDIGPLDEYEHAYLFYFPYREKYYHVDSLLKQYEILDSFSVDYHRWVVNIYQVK